MASACICAAVSTIICASPLEPDVFSMLRHGRESDGFPDRCAALPILFESIHQASARCSGRLKTAFYLLNPLKTLLPFFPIPNCLAPNWAAIKPFRPNATPLTRHRQTARHRQTTTRPVLTRLPVSDGLTDGKPHGLKSARVQFGWVAIRSCWGRSGDRIRVRCMMVLRFYNFDVFALASSLSCAKHSSYCLFVVWRTNS